MNFNKKILAKINNCMIQNLIFQKQKIKKLKLMLRALPNYLMKMKIKHYHLKSNNKVNIFIYL